MYAEVRGGAGRGAGARKGCALRRESPLYVRRSKSSWVTDVCGGKGVGGAGGARKGGWRQGGSEKMGVRYAEGVYHAPCEREGRCGGEVRRWRGRGGRDPNAIRI